MTLHLIKLGVGVDDLAHMRKLQEARRKERRQKPGTPHWTFTRNTPKRQAELLEGGGSLYWVIRGVVRCRQKLVGFDGQVDDEGRPYCRIKMQRKIVPTAPMAWQAFQGWRYLEPARAPPDLSSGDSADLPPEMAAELKRLGLL